jgi:two-component system, sensor histidine kinase and response regulator
MIVRPGILFIVALAISAVHCRAQEQRDSLRLSQDYLRAYDFYLSYPDSAITLANKNLPVCIEHGYSFLEGSYYYLLSKAYWTKGNYKLSTEYGFKALRIVKDTPNEEAWISSLLALGRTFVDLRDFEQANIHINRAIALSESNTDKRLLADSYREKSIVLVEEGDYDSAHFFADQGITMYKQFRDTLNLSILIGRKARIFFHQKNFENSVRYNRISMRYDRIVGNRRALGFSYLQAAQNSYALKKTDSAIYFLKRSIPINTDFGNITPLIRSYNLLADIYVSKGQPLLAVEQLKIVSQLKDSLYNVQKTGQVEGIRALFDLETKENTIKLLEQENSLQQQQVQTQRIAAIFLGVVILLLALLSFFFWRWRTVQANANRELEKQKQQIELQADKLQEVNQLKTKLFSVIGHDLRGPLANLHALLELLTNNLVSADEFVALSGKLKAHLSITQRTLENLLNWSLSQMDGIKTQQKRIDISTFIDDAKRLMLEVAQRKKITLDTSRVQAIMVLADPNQLHLILRNIIHNAIKFSKENSDVVISAEPDGLFCRITIADQGIGMTPEEVASVNAPAQHFTKIGTHHEKGTGLGLLLCKEFISKMHGTIHIESDEGKGTTVSLTIPV